MILWNIYLVLILLLGIQLLKSLESLKQCVFLYASESAYRLLQDGSWSPERQSKIRGLELNLALQLPRRVEGCQSPVDSGVVCHAYAVNPP